jgi:hypothetical protein
MPEVGVALTAKKLNPAHAVAVVRALYDVGLYEFRMEAGPPAPGIELALRVE